MKQRRFLSGRVLSDLNDLYDFELPVDFYGAFYSLGAITTGRLAPEGWRVASEQDWIELENFVAQDGNAGATGASTARCQRLVIAGAWQRHLRVQGVARGVSRQPMVLQISPL